jgi:hypothetical protein
MKLAMWKDLPDMLGSSYQNCDAGWVGLPCPAFTCFWCRIGAPFFRISSILLRLRYNNKKLLL